MTFREALGALYAGNYVALKQWDGNYWYVSEGLIMLHKKDGTESETPFFGEALTSGEWVIVEPDGIKPYQQRMMMELEQVNDRLNGLKDFMETAVFEELDIREKTRMRHQRQGMEKYVDSLFRRVKALGLTEEVKASLID